MKWTVGILSFLVSIPATAQQLHLDTYTIREGLTSNEIRCITQGANGFMYFGTPSGLSSYDGSSFKKYNSANGFHHSLVLDVEELDKGNIAFFPTAAAVSYHIRGQRLTVDSVRCPSFIRSVYKASHGKVFACTAGGLYRYEQQQLVRVPIYEQDSLPQLNCITEWLDSFVVIGRDFQSVDVFNKYTWKLVSRSAAAYFVRNLLADAHGNVWVGCIEKGVLLMDKHSANAAALQFASVPACLTPLATTEFRSITEDRAGNLWMGTVGKGLVRYHPVSGQCQYITTANGLVGNTVFSVYTDREDHLWIGTNNGLQKLVHKDWQQYSSRNGLTADLILDVLLLPGGGLVTAGYSGLSVITPDDKVNTWDSPFEDKTICRLLKAGNRYYALSSHQLTELSFDRGQIKMVKTHHLTGNFCTMIAYRDVVLLGGDHAFGVLEKGRIRESSLQNNRISCMAFDSSGVLWTGSKDNTLHGYRLDDHKALTLLFTAGEGLQGVTDNVYELQTDRQGRIWYSTVLNGVYMLERKGDHYQEALHISHEEGLSENGARGLLWYDDTTLLTGSGTGLDKIAFQPATGKYTIRNIGSYYNFSSTVYKIDRKADGTLILGTESGLFILPQNNVSPQNAQQLPVYFTGLSLLSNADTLIDISRPVRLPYYESSFMVSFASPGFANEKTLRYTYRLQGGTQAGWSKPATGGSLTFSNLSPGSYVLEVKVVDADNRVSLATASLPVIIAAPFWQRWWFLLLLVVATAALVYVLLRRRVANIRRQALLKQKIAETEMMALRAQMNPHFIFNCISSIDNFILDNDKENASGWLNKFARLIRSILDSSKSDTVPFWKDWETLNLYIALEQLRNDGQFRLEQQVDEALLNGHYRIPPLVIQPYVENAIHHGLKHRKGGGGLLTIKAVLQHGSLEYHISDNGIGRKAAAALNAVNQLEHNSYGMQMSRERIALFNDQSTNDVLITDLYDEAGHAAGTAVKVTLWV